MNLRFVKLIGGSLTHPSYYESSIRKTDVDFSTKCSNKHHILEMTYLVCSTYNVTFVTIDGKVIPHIDLVKESAKKFLTSNPRPEAIETTIMEFISDMLNTLLLFTTYEDVRKNIFGWKDLFDYVIDDLKILSFRIFKNDDLSRVIKIHS